MFVTGYFGEDANVQFLNSLFKLSMPHLFFDNIQFFISLRSFDMILRH